MTVADGPCSPTRPGTDWLSAKPQSHNVNTNSPPDLRRPNLGYQPNPEGWHILSGAGGQPWERKNCRVTFQSPLSQNIPRAAFVCLSVRPFCIYACSCSKVTVPQAHLLRRSSLRTLPSAPLHGTVHACNKGGAQGPKTAGLVRGPGPRPWFAPQTSSICPADFLNGNGVKKPPSPLDNGRWTLPTNKAWDQQPSIREKNAK